MKAIKQADVVISTVGHMQMADQTKIVDAIKEAGNVKVCWLVHLILVWGVALLSFLFLSFLGFFSEASCRLLSFFQEEIEIRTILGAVSLTESYHIHSMVPNPVDLNATT